MAYCVGVVRVRRNRHERSTVQSVLRCAEGHTVARVLPSGALGERDVRDLGGARVVLGELGLVGVLREVP